MLGSRPVHLHATHRIDRKAGGVRRPIVSVIVLLVIARLLGVGHGVTHCLCAQSALVDDMAGSPAYIPLQGMVSRAAWPAEVTQMHNATKTAVLTRLKRIEGQVGGLRRMVEEDRYCVDLLTQINAVRAALHKVEEQVLRDHVSHCVAGAFTSGDVVEQRHKVEELIDTIARMTR
jgi:DNA-binding FrmR family transcriptional regulator